MKISSIEIGRSGVWDAKKGGRVELTPKDLSDIAESFDPAKRPVILKIGHDEITTSTPDCGVALAVKHDAKRDRLVADIKPTEYLTEKNRKGAFTKISMELFKEGSRYVLKAIAFLGAHGPAIHGLEPVALAAGDRGTVLVCCATAAEPTESERADLVRRGDLAAANPNAYAPSEIHERTRAFMLSPAGRQLRYVEALELIGALRMGENG